MIVYRGYVNTPSEGAWFKCGVKQSPCPKAPMDYDNQRDLDLVSCVEDLGLIPKYFTPDDIDRFGIQIGCFLIDDKYVSTIPHDGVSEYQVMDVRHAQLLHVIKARSIYG